MPRILQRSAGIIRYKKEKQYNQFVITTQNSKDVPKHCFLLQMLSVFTANPVGLMESPSFSGVPPSSLHTQNSLGPPSKDG